MASIRIRARKDGTLYWAVLYRHAGKQTSASFNDEKEARRFRDLVGVASSRVVYESGLIRMPGVS
ncbi:hypothetical protein [Mycobacterium avium]|uniref:hypothetical protein n=1 Tax=Mycobacterium avium TaxID=1764 RepID=UPI000CE3C895|nr:hypothetical protein [Mycobacterium avium]